VKNNFLRILFWSIAIIDILASNAFAAMSTPMSIIYGSAIAGGSSILGGLLGKKKKKSGPSYEIVPDYAETKEAREMWWNKLKSWAEDPNYGAISPDWADIWQQAQDKVREYYQGTILAPTGAYSKLKSQAAKNGMIDQPGYLRSVARLQAQEAKDYQNLAATEAINKANFAEQGRLNWLTGLQNIANLKQNVVGGSPNTQSDYGVGNAIADIGGAIGQGFTNWGLMTAQSQEADKQRAFLEKLYGMRNTPLSN